MTVMTVGPTVTATVMGTTVIPTVIAATTAIVALIVAMIVIVVTTATVTSLVPAIAGTGIKEGRFRLTMKAGTLWMGSGFTWATWPGTLKKRSSRTSSQSMVECAR